MTEGRPRTVSPHRWQKELMRLSLQQALRSRLRIISGGIASAQEQQAAGGTASLWKGHPVRPTLRRLRLRIAASLCGALVLASLVWCEKLASVPNRDLL